MRDTVEEKCRAVQDGLTGSWLELHCTHNCFGELPGDRCCETTLEARKRTRSSLHMVAMESLSFLRPVASNKWRSITTAVALVAPPVFIHQGLRKALQTTLATKGELARLARLIQEH